MADERVNQGELRDEDLDEVLRQAGRRLAQDAALPGEVVLSSYLAGSATEQEIHEVRAALAASPGFRKALAEMASDVERLHDPGAEKRFDALAGTVPSARRRRASLGERIVRMLTMPAFAYASMILLLGYPAARYLAGERIVPAQSVAPERELVTAAPVPARDPAREEASPLLGGVSLTLRSDSGARLRGSSPPVRLPEVELDPARPLLHLQLDPPASAVTTSTWDMEIADGAGRRWTSEVRETLLESGDSVIAVSLDTRLLAPGTITITLRGRGAEPAEHLYRFEIR